MAYGAVIVCKLARCHAGPGCPICEDVPCDCARCREAKAAGGTAVVEAPEPAAAIPDLMAALKASLATKAA